MIPCHCCGPWEGPIVLALRLYKFHLSSTVLHERGVLEKPAPTFSPMTSLTPTSPGRASVACQNHTAANCNILFTMFTVS